MRLPDKVTPYKKSSLAKFPLILEKLQEENMTPIVLYKQLRSKIEHVPEFIEILCCLYALNKIDFIDGEILCYVENATV